MAISYKELKERVSDSSELLVYEGSQWVWWCPVTLVREDDFQFTDSDRYDFTDIPYIGLKLIKWSWCTTWYITHSENKFTAIIIPPCDN